MKRKLTRVWPGDKENPSVASRLGCKLKVVTRVTEASEETVEPGSEFTADDVR